MQMQNEKEFEWHRQKLSTANSTSTTYTYRGNVCTAGACSTPQYKANALTSGTKLGTRFFRTYAYKYRNTDR